MRLNSLLIVTIFVWKGAFAMTPTEFFHQLSSSTMSIVKDFYQPGAVLVDPIGRVEGADRIRAYYEHQYKSADSISWTIEPEIISGKTHILSWTMHLKASGLNGGKPFDVQGMSKVIIESDGKASFHQDYFDVGAFVYERVPVLKNVISLVKGRLKKGVEAYDDQNP